MKSSSRPTNAIDCSARCNVSSIECDECNHCRRRVDVSLTVECATRTTEGARAARGKALAWRRAANVPEERVSLLVVARRNALVTSSVMR